MKRILLCLLFLILLTAAFSLCVFSMDNGIEYDIRNDTVTITGYNGISKSIVIPGTIEGKPVTKIAPYAFERTNITSVTSPDTIEEIGEKAFFRCFDLTKYHPAVRTEDHRSERVCLHGTYRNRSEQMHESC